MKKSIQSTIQTLTVLLLGSTLFWGCSPESSKSATSSATDSDREPGYEINVTVKNFAANKAYLAHHFGSSNQIADSAVASNGSFTFSGDQWLPEGLYMVILPPRNTYFEIVVDHDQHFSLSTDTLNYTEYMQVEGSEENEVMYSDIEFLTEQRKKVQDLQAQLQAAAGNEARGNQIKR